MSYLNPAQRKRAAKYLSIREDRASRADKRVAAPLACGKLCYPSKSRAKSAIRAMHGLAIGGGRDESHHLLMPYPCPRCDCWHVGHGRPPAAVAR